MWPSGKLKFPLPNCSYFTRYFIFIHLFISLLTFTNVWRGKHNRAWLQFKCTRRPIYTVVWQNVVVDRAPRLTTGLHVSMGKKSLKRPGQHVKESNKWHCFSDFTGLVHTYPKNKISVIFFCGWENFRVHTQRIRIVFNRPHVSDRIGKFSGLFCHGSQFEDRIPEYDVSVFKIFRIRPSTRIQIRIGSKNFHSGERFQNFRIRPVNTVDKCGRKPYS